MARRWEKKPAQVLVQELVIKAQQLESSESICMIGFGVQGLVLITDTVNDAVLHPDAIQQLKSRHMQEIMAAYYHATIQGEKAALNLQNALTMSLSELGILRTALGHVTMPSKGTTTSWSRWFKKAHVKEALQELETVDSSKLVLPTSLLTDFDDAMAAYDMVVKLCKKRRRRSLRKRATAKAVHVACIVSVIVFSFVRVGLAALAVAAGVLTSGVSAIGAAVTSTGADALLMELIDTLNLKIGAVNAKREVLRDAEGEARNLHLDMKTIKIRLEVLQGELHCLSSNVGQAQRLHSLSGLLEAQVHAELLNHHDNLMELKASCANLIRSILKAYDNFKKHSAIID